MESGTDARTCSCKVWSPVFEVAERRIMGKATCAVERRRVHCGEPSFSRVMLGRMQNCENRQPAAVYGIWNDVRRPSYDQLARARLASGAAKVRVLRETFNRCENSLRHTSRSGRTVLLDVLPNLCEVCDCSGGPNYSHDGGGNLRFRPQDLNHRETFL